MAVIEIGPHLAETLQAWAGCVLVGLFWWFLIRSKGE